MSNFTANTLNPKTRKYEMAHWLDNHFGHRVYGIQFIGEDKIHNSNEGIWLIEKSKKKK